MTVETNGSDLGVILGLSPAFISFGLVGTSAVNVTTGLGNDTVDVRETGAPLNLSTSGGHDTINVGDEQRPGHPRRR